MSNKRIKKKQHKRELEKRLMNSDGPELTSKQLKHRVNMIYDLETKIGRINNGMQRFIRDVVSVIKFVPSNKTGGDDD